MFHLKIFALSFLIAFFACPRSRDIVDRFGSNYFPLETGKKWLYKTIPNNDTISQEIIGDTVLLNEKFKVMARGGSLMFYIHKNTFVETYFKQDLFFAGREVTLEENILPHLPAVLINGEEWQDEITRKVELSGDTLTYTRFISFRVEGPVDEYPGPGNLENLYRVERKIKIKKQGAGYNEVIDLNRTEFYAPDIGLIYQANDRDTLVYIGRAR